MFIRKQEHNRNGKISFRSSSFFSSLISYFTLYKTTDIDNDMDMAMVDGSSSTETMEFW